MSNEIKTRSLTPTEQKYTYAQSMQLEGQTGTIGHLRGDFATSRCNSPWRLFRGCCSYAFLPDRRAFPIAHAQSHQHFLHMVERKFVDGFSMGWRIYQHFMTSCTRQLVPVDFIVKENHFMNRPLVQDVMKCW